MKDTKAWIERLRNEAEECRLISRLATNRFKQEAFARLAETTDKQIDELEQSIASGHHS